MKLANHKHFTVFLLLYLLLGISFNSSAITKVEYTPALNEAMQHMASLRLVQAKQIIAKEIKGNPQNATAHYLYHYAEFFNIMVQYDKTLLPAFEKQNQLSLKQVELLPESSPYKLFYKSSIRLQAAFVKGAFNEYLAAAWDFRTAFQEANINEKKFPQFLGHKKELGTLMALLGSFPPQYNWILHAVGLEGDFNGGLAILKNYIQSSANEPLIEKQQASIIYALIQLNFGKDHNAALTFYTPFAKEYTSNLMQCYVKTYIAAKTGETDLAIKTLRARPTGEAYIHITFLDYIMGDLLLHQLDQDAAIWYKKYITFSKTKNSIKDAYQKLSWLAWLDGDTTKFLIYHDLMQKNTKDAGSELKLVNADLAKGIYPNTSLLQARLLFDGGYNEKALAKLKSIQKADLKSSFQSLEYQYRLGRVYQEMKKTSEAIQYFNNCLEQGKGVKSYLLPNTCLQLGLIYENLNYASLAKSYYEQVSSYSGVDYESSLHQKAKTNLWRLKTSVK
ncbi:MAG: hypothetical protein MH472_10720 [Bacteroidia bacterium]|nr:hypothetical protein [Bacteroidia bacterium]